MARSPGLAVLTIALACTGIAGCADEDPETGVITLGVAAAPSLSAAFTEIIEVFEAEHPDVRVSIELGRSNDIAEGLASRTDINVFASAGEHAMDIAVAAGAAVNPEIFARNDVVLAVPSGNPRRIASLRDLERNDIRVGLCEINVPCGRAASSLLNAAGVDPGDVERVAGSRALASQLADNHLDVGIVYSTDVASSHGWVVKADVDEVERELEQAAGTTSYHLARVTSGADGANADAETAASEEFIQLVLSSRGRQALRNSGLDAMAE